MNITYIAHHVKSCKLCDEQKCGRKAHVKRPTWIIERVLSSVLKRILNNYFHQNTSSKISTENIQWSKWQKDRYDFRIKHFTFVDSHKKRQEVLNLCNSIFVRYIAVSNMFSVLLHIKEWNKTPSEPYSRTLDVLPSVHMPLSMIYNYWSTFFFFFCNSVWISGHWRSFCINQF